MIMRNDRLDNLTISLGSGRSLAAKELKSAWS